MKPRTARQVSGTADSALSLGQTRRGASGSGDYDRGDNPSFVAVRIVTGEGHQFTTTKRSGSVEARCTCGVLFTAERPKHLAKELRLHLEPHAQNDV